MRTQETRAVEGLAKTLFKLLDKAENEGLDIYNDNNTREALEKLQTEISNWGLE